MIMTPPETFTAGWPGPAFPPVLLGLRPPPIPSHPLCPVHVLTLSLPVPTGLPHLSQESSNMG